MPAVDPEWFFSTIAQATAASIGFLIAFLAAQYTARKNKTQDNYNDLMDHLDQLEETYNPILRKMEKQLTGVTSFPSADGTIENTFDANLSQSFIRNIARQYSQTNAVQMYANLKRSQKLLDQIILPQPNNVKSNYIRRLNETAKEMIESIESAGNAEKFLNDTNIGHLSPKQVRNKHVFPRVNSTTYPGRSQTQIDTYTLQSWTDILKKFRQEAARAAMKAQNSELTVSFKEYQMLLDRIFTLFFVGVLFPMLFLFSWSPNWWVSFTGWQLTALEIVILAAISYHTVMLFNSVRFLVELSSKF